MNSKYNQNLSEAGQIKFRKILKIMRRVTFTYINAYMIEWKIKCLDPRPMSHLINYCT
jgi:hypothetical protein